MKAEIIAVGSELLTPSRVDTNSLYITERLNETGIDVRAKIIVGDDRGDLAAVFEQALRRATLVVFTGGLGPTDDDLTRDVVAATLGLPLEENAAVVAWIQRRFESRGLRMPDINRRQAMVPRGATLIENPNGTAPGLLIEHDGRTIVLLPGPPREMKPMLDRLMAGRLAPLGGGAGIYRRVLRITGRTESHVEEAAQPLYEKWAREERAIATTILAALGQIELHLSVRARDRSAADAALGPAVADLVEVLGDDVYSVDGRLLEEVVGGLLRDRAWRIAVAESCTGGLTTSRLTDVPGSSAYVDRAVVVYSDVSKIALLGVRETLLREHGAVSEPVARAMAAGIRERAGVDVGLGITGIAGPTGGTPDKPVGTVAIAADIGGEVRARMFRFLGGREHVKFQASQAALDMVRRSLL